MLEFRYRPEGLAGSPPPSLPKAATYRLRPLIPIRIYAPSGRYHPFAKALLDTGADDTVFPSVTATALRLRLFGGSSHQLRWRGTSYPLCFATVELEISTRDRLPLACHNRV